MLAENDILLPEDVTLTMLSEIVQAKRVDVPETNHYSIMFQVNKVRDRALKEFLES